MEKAAKVAFAERERRFAAVHLETSDHVPLETAYRYLPAKYCGGPHDAAYYDCDTWLGACKATVTGFVPTDISRAKYVVGGHLCIRRNVQVTPGRGLVDDVRPENLKALIDFTIEYGVYV